MRVGTLDELVKAPPGASHGADAHLFQRRVIQLASIVLFHLPSESDDIRPVNKNVQLLMD